MKTKDYKLGKKCPVCSSKITNKSSYCHKHVPRSDLWRKKQAISKLGKNNPQWKGDKVGYLGLHLWVKRYLTKPKFCDNCKIVPPLDLANISQEYRRDLNDWEWLCRKCHMKKDGRIKNLKQYSYERDYQED